MKRKIWITICLIMLCIMGFSSNAYAAESDFYYEVTSEGVVITRYSGSNMNVVIPDTIEGKEVVAIRGTAFYYDEITSISIPSSVKSIEGHAFEGCEELQQITFRGDGLERIGERAFFGCRSLKSFYFPSTLKYMGEMLFGYCPFEGTIDWSKLTNVEFAGSMFYCCDMKKLIFPADLKEIPDDFCGGCDELETVVLGKNTKKIGESAFSHCYKLKNVNFPEGLLSISGYAFYACEELTTVSLPSSITYLDPDAFWGSDLKTVYCEYGSYVHNYFKKAAANGSITLIMTGTYLVDTAITINVGDKQQLRIANNNGATIFSSSNKKIATVTSKGVVKGLKKGTVTIMAKNGNKVSTCKVTVKALSLNYKKATITEGFTLKLKLSGKGKTKWSSSNKKVATVSSKGVVKAKKAGKVTITAKRNGKKYKCKITIKKNTKNLGLYKDNVYDYPAQRPMVEISKVTKEGNRFVAELVLTNNTYWKIDEIATLDVNIYAGGSLILSKKITNQPMKVSPYSRGKIQIVFTGSEIKKKKVDLRTSYVTDRCTGGMVRYTY